MLFSQNHPAMADIDGIWMDFWFNSSPSTTPLSSTAALSPAKHFPLIGRGPAPPAQVGSSHWIVARPSRWTTVFPRPRQASRSLWAPRPAFCAWCPSSQSCCTPRPRRSSTRSAKRRRSACRSLRGFGIGLCMIVWEIPSRRSRHLGCWCSEFCLFAFTFLDLFFFICFHYSYTYSILVFAFSLGAEEERSPTPSPFFVGVVRSRQA